MSSSCGKDIEYKFCNYLGSGQDCDSRKGISGAGKILNPYMGNAKDTDLVIMHNYKPFDHGAVTVFNDSNCYGDMGAFFSDEDGK